MAVFLSPEWLQELDAVARASSTLTELGRGDALVVEQQVDSTPHGDISYHVIVDENGARVVTGRASSPNLTFASDYSTAVALHTGATNAQRELTRGRLKMNGEIGQLVRRADLLKALDDVFADVRARTTVSDP